MLYKKRDGILCSEKFVLEWTGPRFSKVKNGNNEEDI